MRTVARKLEPVRRRPVTRYQVVHTHRHTHTHHYVPSRTGWADAYGPTFPQSPKTQLDTYANTSLQSPVGIAAPLAAKSAAPEGLPMLMEAPEFAPMAPKPDGFWSQCSWHIQRAWRTLRRTVLPVVLTVVDFVLRRTSVGFLLRPFG